MKTSTTLILPTRLTETHYLAETHSFNELKDMKEIGKGGSGTVYSATLNGHPVAVKVEHIECVMAETQTLLRLNSSYVPATVAVCYDVPPPFSSAHNNSACLVTELVSCSSMIPDHSTVTLWARLAYPAPLEWGYRVGIALDLCRAVKSVHGAKQIHRDLKTSNLMLDENYRIKLIDFGTALPSDFKGVEDSDASYHYTTPEVFSNKKSSTASDIYAIGIILFELVLKNPKKFLEIFTFDAKTNNDRETIKKNCLNGEVRKAIIKNITEIKEAELKKPTDKGLPLIHFDPNQEAIGLFDELILQCIDPDPTKRCDIDTLISNFECWLLYYASPKVKKTYSQPLPETVCSKPSTFVPTEFSYGWIAKKLNALVESPEFLAETDKRKNEEAPSFQASDTRVSIINRACLFYSNGSYRNSFKTFAIYLAYLIHEITRMKMNFTSLIGEYVSSMPAVRKK